MPKPIVNPIITYMAYQGIRSQYIHEHIYFEKMNQQLYYYLKNKKKLTTIALMLKFSP